MNWQEFSRGKVTGLTLKVTVNDCIYAIPYDAKDIGEILTIGLSELNVSNGARLVLNGDNYCFIRSGIVERAGGLEKYFQSEEWRKRQNGI